MINIKVNGFPVHEAQPPDRIRVWPASENIRKFIRHPAGNIKFRETVMESVEWPFDTFTKRRLADGTVLDHPPDSPITTTEQ